MCPTRKFAPSPHVFCAFPPCKFCPSCNFFPVMPLTTQYRSSFPPPPVHGEDTCEGGSNKEPVHLDISPTLTKLQGFSQAKCGKVQWFESKTPL
ncbi:hypothetical protein POVWA2_019110 [Plasmodium ovale wallikeri]|uniref:Uncharacterized protein n=1 Tax=Plasmodium ovale wallikeri TaxID=864142 RepID=A0A1A8YRX3_PLAOA|nr:hypothetical protein POVWA2_019110 [Plasmodium ovale wallikeri]SBT35525.1 hypothetical protein POVWA1_027780 [Plasmodium ovale wallikeri]